MNRLLLYFMLSSVVRAHANITTTRHLQYKSIMQRHQRRQAIRQARKLSTASTYRHGLHFR